MGTGLEQTEHQQLGMSPESAERDSLLRMLSLPYGPHTPGHFPRAPGSCLPQLVIILHCTCALLLEGQRPSSQSMMGQAWYMPPHLSPGAMTRNICHSVCFVMGSRTFLPHIVTLVPTRKGIQMQYNEGKSLISRSLSLIMS